MAPTPGMKPSRQARPGETSLRALDGGGAAMAVRSVAGTWFCQSHGCAPGGGGTGGTFTPGTPWVSGTCSSQKMVPCAVLRHSAHNALPQVRQYAMAGVSVWLKQFISI